MVQTPTKPITLADFLKLPETKPASEFVDGQIIQHCLSNGTQMGWLIDLAEELIFVYLADRTISVYEEKPDLLPAPGFASSLQLTVDRLFSWLED